MKWLDRFKKKDEAVDSLSGELDAHRWRIEVSPSLDLALDLRQPWLPQTVVVMVQSPGAFPRDLFPGCLCLMSCLPAAAFSQFSRSAAAERSARMPSAASGGRQ